MRTNHERPFVLSWSNHERGCSPFDKLRVNGSISDTGATLLEILISMVVIALVAAGILNAFTFSRRMGARAGTELSGETYAQQISEELRRAVGGNLPSGLTLNPGVYVDTNMTDPPPAAIRLGDPDGNGPLQPPLDFPAAFRRYQTSGKPMASAASVKNHGDGRMVVVEDLVDLDEDGQVGLNFDGDATVDVRRVRVQVQWTTPTS